MRCWGCVTNAGLAVTHLTCVPCLGCDPPQVTDRESTSHPQACDKTRDLQAYSRAYDEDRG